MGNADGSRSGHVMILDGRVLCAFADAVVYRDASCFWTITSVLFHSLSCILQIFYWFSS